MSATTKPKIKNCKVCGRPYPEHYRPCRWCGRDEAHHAAGDVEVEIQAQARMASCKVEAGLPLTANDTAALNEWGDRDLGKVAP